MNLPELRRQIAEAFAAYRHGVVVRGFDGPDGTTLDEAARMLHDALVSAETYITTQDRLRGDEQMPRSSTEATAACPYCARINEVHSGRDGTLPKSGDIALCWDCHGVGSYLVTGGLYSVRALSADQQAALADIPEIRAVLDAMAVSATPAEAVERWEATLAKAADDEP